jgi:hypothetical protein
MVIVILLDRLRLKRWSTRTQLTSLLAVIECFQIIYILNCIVNLNINFPFPLSLSSPCTLVSTFHNEVFSNCDLHPAPPKTKREASNEWHKLKSHNDRNHPTPSQKIHNIKKYLPNPFFNNNYHHRRVRRSISTKKNITRYTGLLKKYQCGFDEVVQLKLLHPTQ